MKSITENYFMQQHMCLLSRKFFLFQYGLGIRYKYVYVLLYTLGIEPTCKNPYLKVEF